MATSSPHPRMAFMDSGTSTEFERFGPPNLGPKELCSVKLRLEIFSTLINESLDVLLLSLRRFRYDCRDEQSKHADSQEESRDEKIKNGV